MYSKDIGEENKSIVLREVVSYVLETRMSVGFMFLSAYMQYVKQLRILWDMIDPL